MDYNAVITLRLFLTLISSNLRAKVNQNMILMYKWWHRANDFRPNFLRLFLHQTSNRRIQRTFFGIPAAKENAHCLKDYVNELYEHKSAHLIFDTFA